MNPNLLNPVPVTIQQLDRSVMTMDEDAREPIHGARASTSVTLLAQVSWSMRGNPLFQSAGVEDKADGYILVRSSDLRLKGITLKRGDCVVQIGQGANAATTNLYLTKSQPLGHFSDTAGATITRWYFQDRNPVRPSGDK